MTSEQRSVRLALPRFGKALLREHKLMSLFVTSDPSYERAPAFLLEVMTLLFAVALLTDMLGADRLIFQEWKESFARGPTHVLNTCIRFFARAVSQTLLIEVRERRSSLRKSNPRSVRLSPCFRAACYTRHSRSETTRGG